MHLHLVRVPAHRSAPRAAPGKGRRARGTPAGAARARPPEAAPTPGGVNDQAAALSPNQRRSLADVAEPAYAPVSETGDLGHEGSTPSVRTSCLRSSADQSTGLRTRAQRFDSSRRLHRKGRSRGPFVVQKLNWPRATVTAHPPTTTRCELLGAAVHFGVERRWAVDLRPLLDLDLLAEGDPAVAREMDRERPGCRARCGVLDDAVVRGEHARLPALPVAREAIDAVGCRARERGDVGLQRRDLLGRAELDVDVARAEVVALDRKLGARRRRGRRRSARGRRPARCSGSAAPSARRRCAARRARARRGSRRRRSPAGSRSSRAGRRGRTRCRASGGPRTAARAPA